MKRNSHILIHFLSTYIHIFLVKLQNRWSYVLFIYPIIIPIKCTVFIYFVLFSTIFEKHSNIKENNLKITHCTYRCLKIREFRIQSVVGKDPVELEKILGKKNSLFLKKI
jgi:hypothetical protein